LIPELAAFVPHFRLLVEDLAHLSNDDLHQFALAAFPTLALWLLRDARDPDTLFANLDHWVDAFHDAIHAQRHGGARATAELRFHGLYRRALRAFLWDHP
jgi:hypothetical protein